MGSGRSTWHVPGLDVPQPLLLFDTSPWILVTRGAIMAESTCLPPRRVGHGNPGWNARVSTYTIRSERSRCRSRCCSSTFAVPVPASMIMKCRIPRSSSLRQLSFCLGSSPPHCSPSTAGSLSSRISGSVLVQRGVHVPEQDSRGVASVPHRS